MSVLQALERKARAALNLTQERSYHAVSGVVAAENHRFIRRFFPSLQETTCLIGAECASYVFTDDDAPDDQPPSELTQADATRIAARFGADQLPCRNGSAPDKQVTSSGAHAHAFSGDIEAWITQIHADNTASDPQSQEEEPHAETGSSPPKKTPRARAIVAHGAVILYLEDRPEDLFVFPDEQLQERVLDPAAYFSADSRDAIAKLQAVERYDGKKLHESPSVPSKKKGGWVEEKDVEKGGKELGVEFLRESTQLLDIVLPRSGVDGVPCEPLKLKSARLRFTEPERLVAGDNPMNDSVSLHQVILPMFEAKMVTIDIENAEGVDDPSARELKRTVHLMSFQRGPDANGTHLCFVHGGETTLDILSPCRLNPCRVAAVFQMHMKTVASRDVEFETSDIKDPPSDATEEERAAKNNANMQEYRRRLSAAVLKVDPIIYVGARKPGSAAWPISAVYCIDFVAASSLVGLRGVTKLGLSSMFGLDYTVENGHSTVPSSCDPAYIQFNSSLVDVVVSPYTTNVTKQLKAPESERDLPLIFSELDPVLLSDERCAQTTEAMKIHVKRDCVHIVSEGLDQAIYDASSRLAALVLGPNQRGVWNNIAATMTPSQVSAFIMIAVERTMGAMVYEEATNRYDYTVQDLTEFREKAEETVKKEQERREAVQKSPEHKGEFVAAKTFDGPRPGFVFQNGSRGVGYYSDTSSLSSAPATPQTTKTPVEEQSAQEKDDSAGDKVPVKNQRVEAKEVPVDSEAPVVMATECDDSGVVHDPAQTETCS